MTYTKEQLYVLEQLLSAMEAGAENGSDSMCDMSLPRREVLEIVKLARRALQANI